MTVMAYSREQKSYFEAINFFRYFLPQISIFVIKVCFLANADIVGCGNYTVYDIKTYTKPDYLGPIQLWDSWA